MTITSGKGDIRVAIIGVGNCANSLVQGVVYYNDAPTDREIPGLMHAVVGGYHINNVKFVAAFDVDAKKVGLDLADAIWASENNTIKFAEVPRSGVVVQRNRKNDVATLQGTYQCLRVTFPIHHEEFLRALSGAYGDPRECERGWSEM